MALSITAEVNPTLLIWAREQSGYPAELIAKRLGVSVARLEAWELGRRKPTVRQIQELARRYRRPFGVFFLPQPPSVPPLASEYRRLPGVDAGAESPEFRLAIRVMAQRRQTSLELADELGASIPVFSISARLSQGPRAVGQRLREVVGPSVDEQFAWRDDWQAWRSWRSSVEAAGIMVSQFPKVPLDQARGVSLLELPLPVIGINSREQSPAARSFTLLHELVHIALALGHDERVALQETRNEREWMAVERFAEEAASEALVPEATLNEVLSNAARDAHWWDIAEVRKLASKFRVTPLAMATRLRIAGVLTWDEYRRWREAWDGYVATLKPRKGGPTSPVDKSLGRNGRPFAQLVLEAFDANRITAVDASRHLDLRFDHFDDLRRELRLGSSDRRGLDVGE